MNGKTQMFILVCVLLTIVHLFACFGWALAYWEHLNEQHDNWLDYAGLLELSPADQYLQLFYFMLTSVLTVGYGDMLPRTFAEMVFIIVVELVGVFMFDYTVSNLVAIIADPTRRRFLAKFRRVHRTFKWRNLDPRALEDMLHYYEYIWERDRNREFFYENARKLMPEGLQKRIRLAIHLSIFRKIPTLSDLDQETLEKIAIALHPRIFTPGDILVKAGRASRSLFFVTRGRIQAFSSAGLPVAGFEADGNTVLGENSILNRRREACTLWAETYVEAFELTGREYEDIIAAHPGLENPRGVTQV
jgi:hypothetical protein